MDKLSGELQRLRFLPDRQALVIAFRQAADWESIAHLWRAVQEDLDLPAPAVSVDGQGYRLWFALAEPVDAAEAGHFLSGLCDRYLADLPASRLELGGAGDLPPYQLADTERWAAFIDPGMGSLFTDEPWLEMAPNRNQQADLLAAFASIRAGDFARVLALLHPADRPSTVKGGHAVDSSASVLALGKSFADPKQFLLAVMNDPNASPEQRIDAAKALLPYFEKAQ